MDRILSTYSYGICLFSMEVLQDFLKKEKIRSKKLLHKFQKDKKLYLAMQKEGIWFPAGTSYLKSEYCMSPSPVLNDIASPQNSASLNV